MLPEHLDKLEECCQFDGWETHVALNEYPDKAKSIIINPVADSEETTVNRDDYIRPYIMIHFAIKGFTKMSRDMLDELLLVKQFIINKIRKVPYFELGTAQYELDKTNFFIGINQQIFLNYKYIVDDDTELKNLIFEISKEIE
jgi:hypothetical protein